MPAKKIYAIFNDSSRTITPRYWKTLTPTNYSWPKLWKTIRSKQNNLYSDILWLILHRTIRVRKSLYDWGYRVSTPNCYFCNKPETIEHCFLECRRVVNIWNYFLPRIENCAVTVQNIFLLMFPCSDKEARFSFIQLVLSVLYHIWWSRTKATLHNSNIPHGSLINLIESSLCLL